MARKEGKDRGLFEKPTGSGTWWICYFDNYGGKHREKGGAKAQARQLYLRRKAEVAEERHQPAAVRNRRGITLAEAITEYIDTSREKRSWRDDRNFASLWTGALGKLPLEQIGPREVERWKIAWGTDLAPATVNRRLAFLRRVFNIQIRNGSDLKNPVSAVGLFKENNARQRFMSPDELVRLQAAVPDEWWHVVEFAMHTGLRQAEQFCLRWEFVNLGVRVLTVPRSKNGKRRHVPLNDRALAILEGLKAANKFDSPWVFTGQRSRAGACHLSANWFCRAVFTPALKTASIQDMSWHDLRHHHASQLAMAGVPLRTIQELLGHQTIDMTLRYSHLSQEHQLAAVAKLVKDTDKP
jgi:integrase